MYVNGPSINSEHAAIERLYRAVADGEPRLEILQLIYDIHGVEANLRPPVAELRFADRCNSKRSA
jgi:hypothetical protein